MRRCLVLAGMGLGVVSIALGGPLNPPPGPVASTHKTLTEVEPRTVINATNTPGDNDSTPALHVISVSGSYYLTSDLVIPAGKIGIEVTASMVTIDLNGFRIIGPGTGAVWAGIDLGRSNFVTIVNGTISSMAGSGVWGPNSSECRVEGVRVLTCRDTGMKLGDSAIVRRCEFVGNGVANGTEKHGCDVDQGSTVTGCTFRGNVGSGLVMAEGGTVTECAARSNQADGFVLTSGSSITGCSASRNTGDGVRVGDGCTVLDCASFANTSAGYRGSFSVFQGCSARDNSSSGFSVSDGASITSCSSTGNVNGVFLLAGSATISGCTISHNTLKGIVGQGSILNNTIYSNGGTGIETTGSTLVKGNMCRANGGTSGANMVIGSDGCHVEGNTCSDANRGIVALGSGSVLMRNTCHGNTNNYFVDSTQSVGTIINISGGVDITTSNSFANFEY